MKLVDAGTHVSRGRTRKTEWEVGVGKGEKTQPGRGFGVWWAAEGGAAVLWRGHRTRAEEGGRLTTQSQTGAG